MAGPKPCIRCWLKDSPSVDVVDGLKSLRGLLPDVLVLFNPRPKVVPVRKPFEMPKFPRFCRWIKALRPVRNALVCGVVTCPQFSVPVSAGSKRGMAGPDDEIALAPTAVL